jgi:gliding motility-associated-like protein
LSSTTIANPSANPTSTTTYIVSAVLGPCQGSDTVVVTVLPAPVADAGNDGRICLNDSTQLNGAGGINYQWTPATGLSNATTKNPFAKPRQTTSYNLLVTDANGCVSLAADVVTITVIPPPLVNITPDTYVSPGQTIQLHAQGGVNYLWSPPTGLNNPAIPDPIATITQDITYTVVVTTPDGCKAKDSVMIKAYKGPDIYVPTGFTPNHDGKNDLLTPIAVGIKELEYFKVYNRWGQLIFSTNQLRQGWNGKLGIIDQDSGVYAWIVKGITDDGKVIFKKGTVILIR